MEFKDDGKIIVIIFEDGEDLIQKVNELSQIFKSENVLTVISALGMMKEIKMGFWNGIEYEIHNENEPSEVLGISGIITPNTSPNFHFHVTIGKRNGEVKGGHLISAKISNTLEMFLIKGNIAVERREEKGLKKLKII
ncbi:MAG: DUF296 domain-containing protein [Candidatus Hydrothermales bacterium]